MDGPVVLPDPASDTFKELAHDVLKVPAFSDPAIFGAHLQEMLEHHEETQWSARACPPTEIKYLRAGVQSSYI